MAVLRPVKLTIVNYPQELSEEFEIENNPEDENMGTRFVSFSRELWIEAEDFEEVPPKKYNRLYPGNEVRLKGAYIIKCTGCQKDEQGNVTQVFATYDPDSRGGNAPDGRKVRGTIHWVDVKTAADAEIRLYDCLFTDPEPDAPDKDFLELINPSSLEILKGCKIEAMLKNAVLPSNFQFLRTGYFCVDKDSKSEDLVFNRSVALKESFKKNAG
jgi:glutaminyl-tRNA synthetase